MCLLWLWWYRVIKICHWSTPVSVLQKHNFKCHLRLLWYLFMSIRPRHGRVEDTSQQNTIIIHYLQKLQSLILSFGLSHWILLLTLVRPATNTCSWEITYSKKFSLFIYVHFFFHFHLFNHFVSSDTNDLSELSGRPMGDWHFVLNLVPR